MLEEKWHIVLFNGLQARRREQTVDRFRTQKTGELLGFLALNVHRIMPREAIAGTLWPDSDLEAGRASLRTALASLRQQLEPPGTVANSVLSADRVSVRLNPEAACTDVEEFEAACRQADSATIPEQRLQADLQAVALYAGDLLPGYYSEWILEVRARLAQAYRHHLRRVVSTLSVGSQCEQALPYARLLLTIEPYEEEIRLRTMRLYAEAGQREEALRCYQEWKGLLQAEFQASPSREVELLVQQIQQMPVHALPIVLPRNTQAGPSKPSQRQTKTALDVAPPLELPHSPEKPPSLSPSPVRLPLTLSRFFGRETEILQITRLLAPAVGQWRSSDMETARRLVTLTGTGGTGKTRLAIEAGRRLHEEAGLPVTFVSLAEITEANRVLEAVAHGLELTLNGNDNILEQTVAALSMQPQVLILDNYEQLLSVPESSGAQKQERVNTTWFKAGEEWHGADVVQTLLACVPTLLCLVTSRQCLNLEGEQEFPVMPLPTPTHVGTPERLLEFSSVKLFVNRAQLSRPDFQLTPRNVEAVSSLCAQLDGLPLAIELAAAWVSMLSPAQIQARLAQRFDLLVGRKRGRVSRHHSLHEAIEWSYQLLDSNLQNFFASLSVFRGGWTLAAAEKVCAEPKALEYLNALRERSLILFEAREGNDETLAGVEAMQPKRPEAPRYSMLESLREFANAKLNEAQRNTLAERHARWCLKRLTAMDYALGEQANYYAAHQWAQSQPGQEEIYFQLLFVLSRFWRAKGWWRGGLAALQAGMAREGSAYPADYGNLYRGAARLTWLLEDWELSLHYLRHALTVFTSLEDVAAEIDIQNGMGCVAVSMQNRDAARLHFQQALELAERHADLPMAASLHGNLGNLAMQAQEWAVAEEHMQQCLRLHQKCNLALAWSWQNLGGLARAREHWTEARAYFEQSLEEYRQLGETYRIAEVLEQLAEVLEQFDEAEAALRCREESQALSLQLRAV